MTENKGEREMWNAMKHKFLLGLHPSTLLVRVIALTLKLPGCQVDNVVK